MLSSNDIDTIVELDGDTIRVTATLLVPPYITWTEVVALNELRDTARQNLVQEYESALAIPRE